MACAGLIVACFVASNTLISISPAAGMVYMACVLLGGLLVPWISWRRLEFARAGWMYVAAYALLLCVYLVHVAFRDSGLNNLDNILRLAFGVLNGAFFISLFKGDRRSLLAFIAFIALLHFIAAALVSVVQGIDFGALKLAGVRTSGDTNPIPFSQVMIVSLGIVVIFAASRLHEGAVAAKTILLLALFAFGVFAAALTGTRGTMPSLGLMVVLGVVNLRKGSGLARAAILIVPLLVLVGLALTVGGRSLPCLPCLAEMPKSGVSSAEISDFVGLRAEIWRAAIELIPGKWLFGYGLGSFPGVLTRLGIPADSPLYTFNEVHNQSLDLLLETGIAGFIPFAAMLLILMTGGVKAAVRPEWRSAGLILFWVAGSYLLFSLTASFLSRAATSSQFAVYVGMLLWTLPPRGWTPTRGSLPTPSSE